MLGLPCYDCEAGFYNREIVVFDLCYVSEIVCVGIVVHNWEMVWYNWAAGTSPSAPATIAPAPAAPAPAAPAPAAQAPAAPAPAGSAPTVPAPATQARYN